MKHISNSTFFNLKLYNSVKASDLSIPLLLLTLNMVHQKSALRVRDYYYPPLFYLNFSAYKHLWQIQKKEEIEEN